MHSSSSKEDETSNAQNDLAPVGPGTIKQRSFEFAGGSEFPRIWEVGECFGSDYPRSLSEVARILPPILAKGPVFVGSA